MQISSGFQGETRDKLDMGGPAELIDDLNRADLVALHSRWAASRAKVTGLHEI